MIMKPQIRNTAKASGRTSIFTGCCLAVFLASTASAFDPQEASYTVDKTTIMVGDPVELSVTAFCPTNAMIDFPELGREKEIVVLQRSSERLEPGKHPGEDFPRIKMNYTLTSFRLGEHVLSTNAIVCRGMDGNPVYSSAFPDITVVVETSLPEDTTSELANIKPPHKLPGRVPPWLWISALVALTAFLIGLISSKLWKNRETILPKVPTVPPHIIALDALEALKKKGLLENDDCNPFYTELSMILRTYLEGRFQLNAPDETTEEIVEEMSKSPELNGAQRNILQDFMRQADMVKFAQGHPDRVTMESAFETTKQFITETKKDLPVAAITDPAAGLAKGLPAEPAVDAVQQWTGSEKSTHKLAHSPTAASPGSLRNGTGLPGGCPGTSATGIG
jgi:hypothetical protein